MVKLLNLVLQNMVKLLDLELHNMVKLQNLVLQKNLYSVNHKQPFQIQKTFGSCSVSKHAETTRSSITQHGEITLKSDLHQQATSLFEHFLVLHNMVKSLNIV